MSAEALLFWPLVLLGITCLCICTRGRKRQRVYPSHGVKDHHGPVWNKDWK